MKEKLYTLVWIIDQLGTPPRPINNYNNNIITSNGFDLEFWDIRYLNKTWRKKHNNFKYADDSFMVYQFNTIKEIDMYLKALMTKDIPIVLLLSGKLGFWNRAFVKLIESYRIPYCIRRNRTGFFHGEFGRQTVLKSITTLKTKIISYVFNLFSNSMFLRLGVKGPTLIFAGTIYDLEQVNYPINSNRIIYTHTKDYDHYLRTKKIERRSSSDKNIIVFIDQYIPFHEETKQLEINPKLFYNGVLSFINKIEQVTGKEVVFTPHPSSDKSTLEKYVPSNIIAYGKTSEYLNDAYCAITFNSTAILGSIITKTPVILIRYDRVLPKYFNFITNELEKIFEIKSIDIESGITKETLLNIMSLQNDNQTDLFDEYIKHPHTPEKLEFEIICEKIVEYLKILKK